MRISAKKWMTVPCVATAALCLMYCGKPAMQASHTDLDEGQAQGEIDLRLAKTEDVKIQVKNIRDAIRPLQSLLRDLGKVVDVRIHARGGEKPGDRIGRLLKHFEDTLRDATHGLVEHHGQGNWSITRMNRDSGVRIDGRKLENGEELTLSVTAKELNRFEHKLAVIRIHANGTREIQLAGTLFGLKRGEEIRSEIDACLLKLDTDLASLSCKPMRIEMDSNTVINIDRLEFSNDRHRGISVSMNAYLVNADRGMLGTAKLHVEPGHKAEIDVCGRDEVCNR